MRGETIGICAKSQAIRMEIVSVTIDQDSFAAGSLRLTSYARPGKLFTANRDLIVREVGILETSPFNVIIQGEIDILRSSSSS